MTLGRERACIGLSRRRRKGVNTANHTIFLFFD